MSILIEKCSECGLELKDAPKYGVRRYHPECFKNKRRRIARQTIMEKRRKVMGERNCVRCGGKITKLHKQKYCSDYCRWLTHLANWNNNIKKQLVLIK